jgi:hypothetical protein
VLGLIASMIVLYTAPLTVFYKNLVSTWRLAVPTYGALAGSVGTAWYFLTFMTLLPFAPLLLIAVPLDVLMKSLAGFLI